MTNPALAELYKAGKEIIPKQGIPGTFLLQQWERSSPVYPEILFIPTYYQNTTNYISFLKLKLKKKVNKLLPQQDNL